MFIELTSAYIARLKTKIILNTDHIIQVRKLERGDTPDARTAIYNGLEIFVQEDYETVKTLLLGDTE